LVFDGRSTVPYVETSATAPLNVYGQSKLSAEIATLVYSTTLCVRTAAFFGAWERGDFLMEALSALAQRRQFIALDDVTVSPTYLPDLADASLDLLIDGCTGIIHLANRGAVTWADFAARAAEALGLGIDTLQRRRLDDLDLPATRPRYSALASERAWMMPTLEDAIARYANTAQNFFDNSLITATKAQG
jgi:dTDP-4-dehydrorhamnose reductase